MVPMIAFSTFKMPAEDGPNKVTFAFCAANFIFKASCIGTCSVVQIISGIFALIASKTSAKAFWGVEKTTLTFGCFARTAFSTVE